MRELRNVHTIDVKYFNYPLGWLGLHRKIRYFQSLSYECVYWDDNVVIMEQYYE